MITLYRTENCTTCDQVEAALQELVVAHQVVDVDGQPPAKVAGLDFPVIEEGDKLVSGRDVTPYLSELARAAEQWRKFQTDACYVGDDPANCL